MPFLEQVQGLGCRFRSDHHLLSSACKASVVLFHSDSHLNSPCPTQVLSAHAHTLCLTLGTARRWCAVLGVFILDPKQVPPPFPQHIPPPPSFLPQTSQLYEIPHWVPSLKMRNLTKDTYSYLLLFLDGTQSTCHLSSFNVKILKATHDNATYILI